MSTCFLTSKPKLRLAFSLISIILHNNHAFMVDKQIFLYFKQNQRQTIRHFQRFDQESKSVPDSSNQIEQDRELAKRLEQEFVVEEQFEIANNTRGMEYLQKNSKKQQRRLQMKTESFQQMK
eukprot:TRINITY_DN8860_c0_g1_i1.p2 TRINITY_DN8860_c0_g1~~TRINITY_DN8860_c0_g1_i1.p2  ORF type:complete len:122 (-),score=7.97 TRINITY_DN8860_c0_g1_i1:126-491(-)